MGMLAKKSVVLTTMLAGLGLSSAAQAAWTFDNGDGTYNGSAGDPSVTIRGVYAANGGSCTNAGQWNASCSVSGFASASTKWVSGSLIDYTGGVGMKSDGNSEPNHAIDNGPSTNASGYKDGVGNTEGVLLSFASSVVLSSVNINYKSGDADVSLFRYSGQLANLAVEGIGASLTSMASAGWELVGNYGNLSTDNPNLNPVNSGNMGSSWWLITAYNSNYGAATSGGVGQGNDYFKLYAVAGTKSPPVSTNQTPEPASLALVSVALLGAYGARRRKESAAKE